MSEFYCHKCAINKGYIGTGSMGNLTGSEYQLGKFVKHTLPTSSFKHANSIFNCQDYNTYEQYLVNAKASGCAEIDCKGRTNVVWYATKEVGSTSVDGVFSCKADCVKVVHASNQSRIHAYPVASGHIIATASCNSCGNKILT